MGKFETSLDHAARWHQPVCVPRGRDDIFGAAREMVDDLDGWTVTSIDEEVFTIHCEKNNGFLSGTSKSIVSVEGPEGIPNSETHCCSESSGGIRSRDKANVREFIEKFWMRVT